MGSMRRFKVYRFDPENGSRSHFDEFDVPIEKGTTVLEGLYYILENLDGSLAFRSSCRCAVCGSCAMNINDQSRLACRTLIDDLGRGTVVIRPLSNLSILKDLVVDMKLFFENYRQTEPYLIPKEAPKEKEYYQSVDDREKINFVIDCIHCAICNADCPTFSCKENTIGPAALTKAIRFINDSRDSALVKRLAIVGSDLELVSSHEKHNCQKGCPKEIDIPGFISRIKRGSSG